MKISLFEEMQLVEADGIDFFSLVVNPKVNPFPAEHIIASFTKNEFTKDTAYPRASYKFWKVIEGRKVYMVL